MGMDIGFKWNRPPSVIAQGIIGNPGVRIFAATTWHKLIYPFTPYADGHLRDVVTPLNEGEMGVIHYKSPYAHYQYTNTALRHTTPGTTAYWDDTAKAAGKGQELAKAVEAYIKGGG